MIVVLFLFAIQSGKAQQISQAEYFFDNDPGFGNGTSISVTAGDSVDLNLNLSVSSLTSGFHKLYVRIKESPGIWGMASEYGFYVQPSNSGVNTNLIQAEYFFDTDPGFGEATQISIAANDSLDFTNAFSTSGLNAGFHTLYVRTKNSQGCWSLAESRGIFVESPTSGANSHLTQAEYFFDNDPGFGAGNQVSVTAADSLNITHVVSTTSLSSGFHILYFRIKNALGRWSIAETRSVFIQSSCLGSASYLTQAEYFFDSDPGFGSGTPISFTSGDSLDISKIVSTTSLSRGFHNLYLRVKNTSGSWSLNSERVAYIQMDTSNAKIVAIEYYVDTEPGIGNATKVLTSPGDSVEQLFSFNHNILDTLTHKLVSRVKNAFGSWSFPKETTFKVAPCIIPNVNFSFSDVCFGQSVMLKNLSSGTDSLTTYKWDISNDGIIDYTSKDSIYLNFANAGNYQVKLKVTNFVCYDTIIKTIHVYPKPTVSITHAGDSSLCQGQSIVLVANTGPGTFSYQWKKNNSFQASSFSYFQATESGFYKVVVTNENNCTDSSIAKNITVFPLPAVSINPSGITNICSGDSISFNTTLVAGSSYIWKKYGVFIPYSTGTSYTAKQSGYYSVEITDNHGCKNESAVSELNVNPVPSAYIVAVGSTTFCQGDSVELNANLGAGYTYQWFKGATSLPNITLPQLYPASSGNYLVRITSSSNCSAISSPIVINVIPTPTSTFTLPNEMCSSDTILVDYTGNALQSAFYNWGFDGATPISGSGSGPIKLSFIGNSSKIVSLNVVQDGCSSSTWYDTVNVHQVQAVASSIGLTSVCDYDSVVLFVNSGANLSHQWFKDGTILAGKTNPILTVNQLGNYNVITTDVALNCSQKSNIIPVIINPSSFNLAFSANSTNLSALPFNATFSNQTPNYTNYFFDWNFGDGTSSTYFNPSHNFQYNGVYSIRLIAENALTSCKDTLVKSNYISCNGGQYNPCTVTSSIVSSGQSVICNGDSSLLVANSGIGYSYQWTRNNLIIPGAISQQIYAKQAGSYRVIVSDALCSVVSASFVLSHYPGIIPVINSVGSLMPCSNDSLQLLVNGVFNSYYWSTGAITPNTYIKQTGYYSVSITNNYGCVVESAPFAVGASALLPPEICLVGVDTISNHNIVVWERSQTTLIDSFYIYRESTIAGVYDKIGTISYGSAGLFLDQNSNPVQRSYRYRLAAKDTCGQQTLLGDFHKTIHLTISAGMGGSWNLIWDGYEGFSFGSYRIYRGTTPSNLSLLTQLPSTINSYSDLNPPIGNVYYQIEVVNQIGCYPDSIMAKANTNYNSSRSNPANNTMALPPNMLADFSADHTWGYFPTSVAFTDESSGFPTSWTWSFGDGQTSTQQNPSHIYTTQGIYTVNLTISNAFETKSVSKTNFIFVTTTGIEDYADDLKFELYPNPTKSELNLLLKSEAIVDCKCQIFNSIGAEVITYKFGRIQGEFVTKLDVNFLNPGIYFVKISSQNGQKVKRLIIQ